MREILKEAKTLGQDNPLVDVIITRAGISFSCRGKHLFRLTAQEVKGQLEDNWLERHCDSFYFVCDEESYFVSEKQIENLCECHSQLDEDCITGKINTYTQEEMAVISKNSPNVKGIKVKFVSDMIKMASNTFAFKVRYTRAI